MTEPPEIYTGAFFTVRYNDVKNRIGKTEGSYTWGFEAAHKEMVDAGLIRSNIHPTWMSETAMIFKRAELEYGVREINAETPDEWMMHCERVLCELADKYEPVLKASGNTDLSSLDDGRTVNKYGSKIDNLLQDTPYGELSDDSDYTSSQSHVSRGGQDEATVQNGSNAEKVMNLMRDYDSVINAIIKELGDLFMHTVGMDVIL